MSVSHTVLVERDESVVTVTIDRPQQRNALNAATKVELREMLARIGADETVRAVVLTGAGSAFCVGQDLGEHAEALRADPATAFDTVDEHYAPIVTALATMPKPVIAAVGGVCVGAGLGFALACDLRVFAEDAVLGTAFSGIGLTCDSGLSSTLVAAVGSARARALVLRAERFSVRDAVAWGIEGEVCAAAEVLPRAQELARTLAAGPTAAYAASKRLIAQAASQTLAQMVRAEALEQAALGVSADHAAAVEAFLAKRRPVFVGH